MAGIRENFKGATRVNSVANAKKLRAIINSIIKNSPDSTTARKRIKARLGDIYINGRKKGFNSIGKAILGEGNWSYRDTGKSKASKAKRRKLEEIPEHIEDWFRKMEAEGRIRPENGLEAYRRYIKTGNELNEEFASALAEELGIDVHKEHMWSLGGTGSHDPWSQHAGSGTANVSAREADAFTPDDAVKMGRPKNWDESAKFFAAGLRPDSAQLTDSDLLKIQQGSNIDQIMAERDFQNQLKQQGWVGPDDSVRTTQAIRSIEDRFIIRDSMNIGQTHMYQFDEVPYKQQVYLSQKSGKYQKLAPDVEGQFKGIRSFVGVGPRLAKAAQKMNVANQATMTASMLATGNVPGAVVSGVGLAASVGAQNRTVQKNFAKLVTRIAAERGAKSTAKLIPGVDIALTAGEVYSYLSEGKLDQAAIATIGGAIGWIPGAGDFGQALLDGINTAIDVSRMDYNQRDQELDLDRLDKNKVKGSNVENFIGVRSSTPRPRFRLTY